MMKQDWMGEAFILGQDDWMEMPAKSDLCGFDCGETEEVAMKESLAGK
jgi:hypothetical protein